VHGASIFAPAGAPADAIRTLSLLVLAITAVIFLIVGGLLVYCIVRYRRRPDDDAREPPQVYGSNLVTEGRGAKTADYLVCGRCGVYVAAVLAEQGSSYATVNSKTFQSSERFT
jgi:hypothetical protein